MLAVAVQTSLNLVAYQSLNIVPYMRGRPHKVFAESSLLKQLLVFVADVFLLILMHAKESSNKLHSPYKNTCRHVAHKIVEVTLQSSIRVKT